MMIDDQNFTFASQLYSILLNKSVIFPLKFNELAESDCIKI